MGVIVTILAALLLVGEAPRTPEAQEKSGRLLGALFSELDQTVVIEFAEEWFQKGCQERQRAESGEFEFKRAASFYQKLVEIGASNPALYRNLGHAYVLANDLPHAILTLRRGARMWPHDADLQNSLTEARALVIYPADNPLGRPPVEKRPWYLSSLAALGWLLAAFALYTAACAGVTRWWMTRRGWLLAAGVGCLLAASLSATMLTGFLLDADRRQRAETQNTLVVINDDGVLLRKGDSLNYPPRYDAPLNRGVEARLVHERGDWVLIELSRGEVGWVPRRFVLIDRPDAG